MKCVLNFSDLRYKIFYNFNSFKFVLIHFVVQFMNYLGKYFKGIEKNLYSGSCRESSVSVI